MGREQKEEANLRQDRSGLRVGGRESGRHGGEVRGEAGVRVQESSQRERAAGGKCAGMRVQAATERVRRRALPFPSLMAAADGASTKTKSPPSVDLGEL
eukprot:6207112-Pleurochrysis_carterae.AAC.5